MSLLANCSDCSKQFRIPHADRTWECKSCGGELQPIPSPDCPECGTELESGAKFCESCGHAITGDRSAADKAEEKVAAAQMRTAHQKLKMVNLPGIMGVSLFIGGLFLAGQLWALLTEADPSAVLIIATTITAVFCGLNLAGIILVKRKPFPVALILASIQTISYVLDSLMRVESGAMFANGWSMLAGTVAMALGAAFTLAYWGLVTWCARLERLAREFPDSYQARLLRGEIDRKTVDAEFSVARKTRQRSQKRTKAASLRVAAIVGIILLVAVGGYVGNRVIHAAPAPEKTLDSFVAAWNAHDTEELGTFWGEKRASKWSRNIEKLQRKYKWEDELPPLEKFDHRPLSDERIVATFQGSGGALIIRFNFEDGIWRASSLDPRGIKNWQP